MAFDTVFERLDGLMDNVVDLRLVLYPRLCAESADLYFGFGLYLEEQPLRQRIRRRVESRSLGTGDGRGFSVVSGAIAPLVIVAMDWVRSSGLIVTDRFDRRAVNRAWRSFASSVRDAANSFSVSADAA